MNRLLGISPRFWSIFCIVDLGRVIPSFTVVSNVAIIVLLVILVECTRYIAKRFSIVLLDYYGIILQTQYINRIYKKIVVCCYSFYLLSFGYNKLYHR